MRPHRLLLALTALCAACASAPPPAAVPARFTQTVVDTGAIAGAPYRIEIPAGWNGGLVMYAHGYETIGTPFEPMLPRHAQFREAFTSARVRVRAVVVPRAGLGRAARGSTTRRRCAATSSRATAGRTAPSSRATPWAG